MKKEQEGNMLTPNRLMTILVCAALGACSFENNGSLLVENDEVALHVELLDREKLSLDDSSLIGVNATDNYGNELPCLQPSVQGGTATMRTTETGLLLVEKMTVHLSDITIKPGILGDQTILLTNMTLQIGTQIVIDPEYGNNGEFATGQGTADLLLDWSFESHTGNTFPLATQIIRDAQFSVTAELQEDGSIRAEVDAHIDGYLGNFANRIAIADLSIAVKAVSPAN
jgi:hypothetical protein